MCVCCVDNSVHKVSWKFMLRFYLFVLFVFGVFSFSFFPAFLQSFSHSPFLTRSMLEWIYYAIRYTFSSTCYGCSIWGPSFLLVKFISPEYRCQHKPWDNNPIVNNELKSSPHKMVLLKCARKYQILSHKIHHTRLLYQADTLTQKIRTNSCTCVRLCVCVCVCIRILTNTLARTNFWNCGMCFFAFKSSGAAKLSASKACSFAVLLENIILFAVGCLGLIHCL